MNVTIIGAGFVGVVTALSISWLESNQVVTLVEVDAGRAEALARGQVPFFEPGVAEPFGNAVRAGQIRVVHRDKDSFRDDVADDVLRASDVAVLCVGTPGSSVTGLLDMAPVFEAASTWASKRMFRGGVLFVRSTLMPGACEGIQGSLDALFPGKFSVVHWPEFLAEGTALSDLRSSSRSTSSRPRIIGVRDPANVDDALGGVLLRLMPDNHLVATVPWGVSELSKLATNTMLAARLTVANEIAMLAMMSGVDVDDVLDIVGGDERIGRNYLRTAAGWGGSCLPKDSTALAMFASKRATPSIASLAKSNNTAIGWVERHVARIIERGDVDPGPIVVLGCAFKPETSDVRESPAVRVIKRLTAMPVVGPDTWAIRYHDPCVDAMRAVWHSVPTSRLVWPIEGDLLDELRGAAIVILATPWPFYRRADVLAAIPVAAVVIDACRGFPDEIVRRPSRRVIRWGDGTLPFEPEPEPEPIDNGPVAVAPEPEEML